MPVPCGADDRLEIAERRRPVQLGLRLVRSREQNGRVSRTPRRERERDLMSGDARDHVDHLAHRMRPAGPEVVGARRSVSSNRLQRFDVRIGEIGDVHVIALARAVRRRVVVAEDLQAAAAGGRLDGPWDEVDLRRMILADLTLGVGAGRVEIPQRDVADVVRAAEMRQRVFDRQLRLAVAVDRLLRMRLDNRRLDRLAVCRARRRKDKVLDRLLRHRLQHAQRAEDVIAVILRRQPHRLADVEKGGEVHDGENLAAPQGVPDRARVHDVAFDQLAELHRRAMARDQVVEDDDAVAGAMQRFGRVAADVTGAAGDEHGARASVQWRNT